MDEESPGPATGSVPAEALKPNAAAVLDEQGDITAWNDAASELLGYGLEDVLGRPAKDLLAHDLPADIRQRVTDRREWSVRTLLRHRSDGEVPLQLRAFPLTGARSSIRWLVQASEPGTGGSEDGDRGRGGTGMLKEWAWDQLSLPVAVCDGDTRLVAVNQRMIALTGRTEAELLAGGIDDVMPPGAEPLEGVARLAEEVLRDGRTLRHTARVAGGPGTEERIWSMALSPLAGSDDRVRALSVAFVEVTQQARARRRLAVVNEASIRLGRTLDVSETAQELADVGAEFADFVTVDLLDAVLDGGEVDPTLPVGRPLVFRRVAQHSEREGCPESVIPLGEAHAHSEDSPPGRALRSGQSYRHSMDAPPMRAWLAQFPARAESAREHGLHSIMGVPLVARGTTLGIVQFFRHRTTPGFDGDDLLLAQEVSARASVCVDTPAATPANARPR